MEQSLYKHSYKVAERELASLAVYNTGTERCKPGFCWGPGVRDHYLIHFVVEGKGMYTVRGKTFTLGTGGLFLSRPGETIAYRADDAHPWVYWWVGFQGLDAARLLAKTDLSEESPTLSDLDIPALKALLEDIYHARGSRSYDAARMTGRLYLLLAFLMERARSGGARRHQAGEDHVRRACLFIANNFSNPISVEDTAAHVGICRSRLYRAFEEHLGVSPTQYLTRFRMQQASSLLERTDLSVKAVAFSVGFEDPLYFSRRFREVMGKSPTEYAEEARERNRSD